MGKVDESLEVIQAIEDGTERALQLSGLISTLFKLRHVVVAVTGQLAFDSYANTASENAEIELAIFSGATPPRLLQEVMRGQLPAIGETHRWQLAGLPVRFVGTLNCLYPKLCRDFLTEHGVVKLRPVEEITAEKILAAVFPSPDPVARQEANLLLVNGLTEAFQMNWSILQAICNHPEFRVGEILAEFRAEAKAEADATGRSSDPVGDAHLASAGEEETDLALAQPVGAVAPPVAP